MNAKGYAEKFKRELREPGSDPQIILLKIVEDMVRKATYRIMQNPNRTTEFMVKTFEKEAVKWESMCEILRDFPIEKEGFRKVIRDVHPYLYQKLVTFGFQPIKNENSSDECHPYSRQN